MSYIGRLVKCKSYKSHSFWGIGIVLDYRSTGRFVPSTELKIHFPASQKGSYEVPMDIKEVEFIDEDR
tara:strand:- start:82 stop:285 length:204 start_codon:yes stop_codon:yes gene_type:complete